MFHLTLTSLKALLHTNNYVDCSKRVNVTAVDEADPIWWVLISGHLHVPVALDLSMVRSSTLVVKGLLINLIMFVNESSPFYGCSI